MNFDTEDTSVDIAARLESLESQNQVVDRLYAYGHTLDYGLEGEWLDCFTDDATYDLRFRIPTGRSGLGDGTTTETGVVYRGRAELKTFIAAHTRAPERWHKHVSMSARVVVLGNTASCRSYFARLDDVDGSGLVMSSFGRYTDELLRCSDGVWRFSERIFEIEGRKL